MNFFKKKTPKSSKVITSKIQNAIDQNATDDATEPTLKAQEEVVSICNIDSETKSSMAETAKPETPIETPVDAIVPPKTTMHLFPGFEEEAFSIGYNMKQAGSVLMMRWDAKPDEGWFEIPAMFNNAVISKIQERENEKDLSRLLRDYGYDIDSGEALNDRASSEVNTIPDVPQAAE